MPQERLLQLEQEKGINVQFMIGHRNLKNNQLTGPIPSTLTQIPNLKTLDLARNQLIGEIPRLIYWNEVLQYLSCYVAAIIVDESLIVNLKSLNRNSGVKSVPVQFFGTHDFTRINMKQVISFLRGLLSSFHLKCKKSHFVQSLEEPKMYLSEQKLPKRMLKMQNAVEADDCASGSREDEKGADSGEDCRGDERIHSKLEGTKTCPFEIGDLQVISLGKIVKDSEYFQDGRFIWPEGYTAVRKFPSIADPSVYTLYKMEVLKCNDAGPKTQPLFRVTLDNGKQWDALENKSALILYGGGAIFAIWLSSVIVDSINSVPLLPKIMELVGLGYTGWFVYRYLLFKSSRKELADEIEALKKKIAGNG